jgi:electron transfer flavoprotein alpha subunit
VIAFKPSEVAQIEGFAAKLGFPFDLLLLANENKTLSTAEKFLFVPNAANLTADAISSALITILGPYSHIAAVSSMASKDLLPRVTALADGAMVTDVVAMTGPSTFQRAMQAGSVLATVETLGSPVVLTIRPGGFPSRQPSQKLEGVEMEIQVSSRCKIESSIDSTNFRPDLSQAKFIVSGGRPLKDAETFEWIIGGFADAFGGSVGATRAAVDAGIAPNESQIGQTGKIVAPQLYVAAGISGSTQHMAGIKDSKAIVAINKDSTAPIFGAADFGIVGDLYEILPKLQAQLEILRKENR